MILHDDVIAQCCDDVCTPHHVDERLLTRDY